MERLKLLRKSKGLSQQDMANILGIVQTTFHNYENGISEPGIDMLKKIAAYFDTSVDYLVGNVDYSGMMELTEQEASLLDTYRSLPEDIRSHIDNFVKDIKDRL